MLRAAFSVPLPPTIMGSEKSVTIASAKWTKRDRLLLRAFRQYEDSLCGGCGQSSLHTLDVANTREFGVDTAVCLGCNVRETYTENHGDTKTKGLKLYVVNSMGQGGADDG